MSIKYYYKKTIASIFNPNAGFLKSAVVGAATVLTPVYMAGEAVLSDASSYRNPVTGDKQAEFLDKMTTLITATRDAQGNMEAIRAQRQELVENPDNKALADIVRKKEEQQVATHHALESAKARFNDSLLTSEAISEVDAKRLTKRFQATYGDQYLYATKHSTPGAINNHVFSYLDECQKQVLGGAVYHDSSAAQAVDYCMFKKADNATLGAFLSGIVGLPVGFLGLLFLSATGRRYGREVESESFRREYERQRKKAANVKTDEVNLKIKIEKPGS